MTKHKLTYLYRVVYLDGSAYEQNIEDTSITDSNKSCYSDIRLNDVHLFTLSNGTTSSYTLDLLDGGISINRADKIYLSSEELHNFKLVYFRRVTMELSGESRFMSVSYILGYSAIDNQGQEVINTITIR